MQSLLKYPVGIQTFSEIIEGKYVYVDKTERIHKLVNSGKYFFLSRPRRFGKSLLVSTLTSLYQGRKELFKGLWIEDKWDFSQINPTLCLYFNSLDYRAEGLPEVLQHWLDIQAQKFGIDSIDTQLGTGFQELIEKIYLKTGKKVVVLIDEYDKPIIDYLDDVEKASQHRNLLKSFYGILKSSDPYLQLVFITGVSKFTKISLFSDLNNLNDISMQKGFGDIVGINQQELEDNFSREITAFSLEKNIDENSYLDEIKRWYNGYNWDSISKVYNPFSLLRFFDGGGDFKNFWFETGTPTFLIKELYKHRYFDFDNVEASEEELSAFNIEFVQPTALLFQTGYLTIKSYNPSESWYVLTYPNEEVRRSLNEYLLKAFRQNETESVIPMVIKLRNALQEKDLERVVNLLNNLYATLPFDLWQRENERFYHALLHITFTILGTYIQSEIHTSEGRCDAVVHTEKYIYFFEFKLDQSAEIALKQIEKKHYFKPFKENNKKLIGVGINFKKELKGIESYLVKQF